MGIRTAAALALGLAACSSATAQEPGDPGATTMFYVRIPLGATSAAERRPAFGMMLQGRRSYETVVIDSEMFRLLPFGGLEVKWLVAGAVTVAAAAAVNSKNKGREEEHRRAQEEQRRRQQQEPCPKAC